MFNLAEFTTGFIEENDMRAFRLPYKLCGKQSEAIFRDRYSKINPVEKGVFIYPKIVTYL